MRSYQYAMAARRTHALQDDALIDPPAPTAQIWTGELRTSGSLTGHPAQEEIMTIRAVIASVALLAAGTTTASAAIDSYLYIPGVPGESTADRFRDWIDVTALSVAVADRVCSGVTVTKNLDSSSPLLSAAALTGVFYPTMSIQVVRAGSEQQNFLTYSLSSVTVASVGVAVSPTGVLVEQVVLRPAVIDMSYRPQAADGQLQGPIQSTLTCKYR
jgi:type VI secretion system secreted protein Hcp